MSTKIGEFYLVLVVNDSVEFDHSKRLICNKTLDLLTTLT